MTPLEDVQLRSWGFSEREVVPGSLLVVVAHSGGVVCAAYEADSSMPVGFAFGFPAERDGGRVLHSHMLAVVPEHRGTGLAERLKRHQKAHALALGYGVMTWTMDPLMTLNAAFNLNKLSARAVAYLPEWYDTRGGLYADLPADRLLVRWDLTQPDPDGEPAKAAPVAAPLGRRVLEARPGSLEPGEPDLDAVEPVLLVEAPRHLAALKAASLPTALAWRLATRAALGHYMGQGYAATALVAGGAQRVYYRLERAEPAA